MTRKDLDLAGYCENVMNVLVSMKDGKFLDFLGNY